MTDQGIGLPKIGKLYKVTKNSTLYKVTSRPRELKFLHPGYFVMPFRINSTAFSGAFGQPIVAADIDVLAVKIDETGTCHPFTFKFRTYDKAYDGDWREFLTEVEDDKVELEDQHQEESKEPDKLIG